MVVKVCRFKKRFLVSSIIQMEHFSKKSYLLMPLKTGDEIRANVKAMAHGYIESLLKLETVLTAESYLWIVSYTTPLSKYLQTVQLDLLTVHNILWIT